MQFFEFLSFHVHLCSEPVHRSIRFTGCPQLRVVSAIVTQIQCLHDNVCNVSCWLEIRQVPKSVSTSWNFFCRRCQLEVAVLPESRRAAYSYPASNDIGGFVFPTDGSFWQHFYWWTLCGALAIEISGNKNIVYGMSPGLRECSSCGIIYVEILTYAHHMISSGQIITQNVWP